MDLETTLKWMTLVTGVASASYAAIQAGRAWVERTADVRRQAMERRMQTLRELLDQFATVLPIFSAVFDYDSVVAKHLRVDDLAFGDEEAQTRAKTDQAFEFLRLVHASVRMGLIEREDLGPWIYWIHRVATRPVLLRYSEACGYESFRAELARWTEGAEELSMLRRACPWWA